MRLTSNIDGDAQCTLRQRHLGYLRRPQKGNACHMYKPLQQIHKSIRQWQHRCCLGEFPGERAFPYRAKKNSPSVLDINPLSSVFGSLKTTSHKKQPKVKNLVDIQLKLKGYAKSVNRQNTENLSKWVFKQQKPPRPLFDTSTFSRHWRHASI